MQTQPVAPLRSVASGPALSTLDLSLAFPLADDGLSFLDRLEAASASSTTPEQTTDESSRRADKDDRTRESRPSAKRTSAEPEKAVVDERSEASRPVDASPLADPTARRAQDGETADAAEQPADAAADQAVEADARHAPREDRRAAASHADEPAVEAQAAEPSMRQARLETESSRRGEPRHEVRAATDTPTDDAMNDGSRSFTGGAAAPVTMPQRHAPSEPFAREAGGVKALGGVQETHGASPAANGDRVGPSRGGPQDAPRAKEAKRQGPPFPAPQAQESTMVLRTGKALAAALRGAGDVRLNLSPEELGRVQIRMHSDQSGVSVVLGCERPETVASIESGIAELRRSLEDQGVRVKEIVVEGPRSSDPATAADRSSDRSSDDRPATGSDQGARHDREDDVPARREHAAATRREDEDGETDSVVVDRSVGTLLASLDAAGVSTALDTIV
ncbi:MAG: flagellar hook-length control protein FliK [Phycisphaerales bacterium]